MHSLDSAGSTPPGSADARHQVGTGRVGNNLWRTPSTDGRHRQPYPKTSPGRSATTNKREANLIRKVPVLAGKSLVRNILHHSRPRYHVNIEYRRALLIAAPASSSSWCLHSNYADVNADKERALRPRRDLGTILMSTADKCGTCTLVKACANQFKISLSQT
jgi:hypothetical protein